MWQSIPSIAAEMTSGCWFGCCCVYDCDIQADNCYHYCFMGYTLSQRLTSTIHYSAHDMTASLTGENINCVIFARFAGRNVVLKRERCIDNIICQLVQKGSSDGIIRLECKYDTLGWHWRHSSFHLLIWFSLWTVLNALNDMTLMFLTHCR